MASARKQVSQLAGYEPSPLRAAPELASALGLASLHIKDETERLGVGSFKPLGGSIAAQHLLEEALRGGRSASDVQLATASAGNHGIGLAWAARQAGCRACHVFIAEGVGEAMAERMRSLGATVHRVPGTYEDSLAACREESERGGWHVVQDVSWDGYEEVPRLIYEGYTVLSAEMVEQLRESGELPPTHVLVNTGVGGLSSAMCAHLWAAYGAERPRFVVVEPQAAACCMHSARQGACVGLPPSEATTVQVGLDCREPAPLAWRVLGTGASDFTAIGDEAVQPCIELLREQLGVRAGRSAVASLGVVVAAAAQPALREGLGLGPESRVALVVCEGSDV